MEVWLEQHGAIINQIDGIVDRRMVLEWVKVWYNRWKGVTVGRMVVQQVERQYSISKSGGVVGKMIPLLDKWIVQQVECWNTRSKSGGAVGIRVFEQQVGGCYSRYAGSIVGGMVVQQIKGWVSQWNTGIVDGKMVQLIDGDVLVRVVV